MKKVIAAVAAGLVASAVFASVPASVVSSAVKPVSASPVRSTLGDSAFQATYQITVAQRANSVFYLPDANPTPSAKGSAVQAAQTFTLTTNGYAPTAYSDFRAVPYRASVAGTDVKWDTVADGVAIEVRSTERKGDYVVAKFEIERRSLDSIRTVTLNGIDIDEPQTSVQKSEQALALKAGETVTQDLGDYQLGFKLVQVQPLKN